MMTYKFKKNIIAIWFAIMMCVFITSGCTQTAPRNAVSDGDNAVSAADITSPSDLPDISSAPAVSAADVSTTTTPASSPETTTAKTTWNDEYPSVAYSETKYKIVVYLGSQSTVVYSPNENGEYTDIVKRFSCSTGASETPTRRGIYRARAKYRWRFMNGVYGQYCTSISTNYLFHSVPYKKKDVSTLKGEEYDKLGTPASHGCIRMCVRDCKWIYDNIPLGTEVEIVSESGPSGPGVPARKTDSRYDGWDPSDKWAQGSPYFNKTLSAS